MHAVEVPHIVQTLPIQRLTAFNALRISSGRPLHIGPVTLKPHRDGGLRTDLHGLHRFQSRVNGLARVVVADYGSAGIRVNIVVPGYTETTLVRAIADDPANRAGLVDATMLGRPGTASDVEGIMVYLPSEESAYPTGGVFTVDGGLTAL
jgi:hypothetical protein